MAFEDYLKRKKQINNQFFKLREEVDNPLADFQESTRAIMMELFNSNNDISAEIAESTKNYEDLLKVFMSNEEILLSHEQMNDTLGVLTNFVAVREINLIRRFHNVFGGSEDDKDDMSKLMVNIVHELQKPEVEEYHDLITLFKKAIGA
jgi:hypothetical protein